MKKNVLFNLSLVQSNTWAAYQGGGENDFTVLMHVLADVGNHPDWQVYGYYVEGYPFIRDMEPILGAYKHFKLISNKELDVIKQQITFQSIYSSCINGLRWILREKLLSQCSIVVIHGVRRYELRVTFCELFLPNRMIDRAYFLLNYFAPKILKRIIEQQHRKLVTAMPPSIQLIATSDDTKEKLLAMCPAIKSPKLRTLYTSNKTLDLKLMSSNQEELVLEKYNLLSKNYFLLISLGRVEKNIYFALKNLKRLLKEHALPLKIFACGEAKKSYLMNQFKQHPNIGLHGYIPGDELYILYKHAFLFVYPTRTEGFGMPILEAMEHGTPVCCSALSPLIEVGGNAAEYFSLENDIEFRAKILKLYNEPDFYEHKKQLSLARYKELSIRQESDLKHKKNLILGY